MRAFILQLYHVTQQPEDQGPESGHSTGYDEPTIQLEHKSNTEKNTAIILASLFWQVKFTSDFTIEDSVLSITTSVLQSLFYCTQFVVANQTALSKLDSGLENTFVLSIGEFPYILRCAKNHSVTNCTSPEAAR